MYHIFTVAVITCYSAKVTPENLNELTALDVARNWGDDYIYAIMYAKAGASQAIPAADKKGTIIFLFIVVFVC